MAHGIDAGISRKTFMEILPGFSEICVNQRDFTWDRLKGQWNMNGIQLDIDYSLDLMRSQEGFELIYWFMRFL